MNSLNIKLRVNSYEVKCTLTSVTHLQENLEIIANVNEIKVPVEMKDVDAAARATSV